MIAPVAQRWRERRASYRPAGEVIVGLVFGSWTVAEERPARRGRRVLVRCTCGTERELALHDLRRGGSKSCGCMKAVLIAEKKLGRSLRARQPAGAEAAAVDGRRLTSRDVDRFRSLVHGGAPDACWPWEGGAGGEYGRIGLGGRRYLAHRIAFALANGVELVPEQVVRHRCDNPPCCNPAHLLLGTQADNIRDAVERSRMARGDGHGLRRHPERRATGEQHGQHVLTLDQVHAVLAADFSRRGTAVRIARELGVSPAAIRDIRAGRRWSSAVAASLPYPKLDPRRIS